MVSVAPATITEILESFYGLYLCMAREKERRFWGEIGNVNLSCGSNKVKVRGRQSRFLLVDCCGWVEFLGSAFVKICWIWTY